MGIKLWRTNPQREDGHEEYLFTCPGCGYGHSFVTKWGGPRLADMKARGLQTPLWTFNGDLQKPTFSPSLLYEKSESVKRCHLFLRDGNLEFLSDCEHHLAGKTVPLADAT